MQGQATRAARAAGCLANESAAASQSASGCHRTPFRAAGWPPDGPLRPALTSLSLCLARWGAAVGLTRGPRPEKRGSRKQSRRVRQVQAFNDRGQRQRLQTFLAPRLPP